MSTDSQPTAEAMAAANADMKKRSEELLMRIRANPLNVYLLEDPCSLIRRFSFEEECPSTIDAFDETEAGDAVLDALLDDRE